jgi:hypothetical protein
VEPSIQPTVQPSAQPTYLLTSGFSYSYAPTVVSSPIWTAQIMETSFLFGVAVVTGNTIACGGLSRGICLQFSNPTGLLSAVYGLPWDRNNALAVVDDGLILVGQWNSGQRHAIARFQSESRQFAWVFTTLSQEAQLQAVVFNNESQQVIVVGYDSLQNAVVASVNKDSGIVVWGYTYQLAGLKAYIFDVDCIPQFRGSCMTGYVIDKTRGYKRSILLMWIDISGSLLSLSIVTDESSDIGSNCIFIEPISGDAIVAGNVLQSAQVTRVHNSYGISSVVWAVVYDSVASESMFEDILISDNFVFVVGYSTGFPSTLKKDMIVVQLDVDSGNTTRAVRISGPGNTICYSLTLFDNGIRVSCSFNGEGMLFYLDKSTLIPGDLPVGFNWYFDILSVLTPSLRQNLLVTSTPSSQRQNSLLQATVLVQTTTWPPSVFKSMEDPLISSLSFTQAWPKNLVSARPTTAPTVLLATPGPTVAVFSAVPSTQPTSCPSSSNPSSSPSSIPSGNPTSAQSISCLPTGSPGTSVPTLTYKPQFNPTPKPTTCPSTFLTQLPTTSPTHVLTSSPSERPSKAPTVVMSNEPSPQPSRAPSSQSPSSGTPTRHPSVAGTISVVTTSPINQVQESVAPTPQPSVTASALTNAPSILSLNKSSQATVEISFADTLWISISGSIVFLIVAYIVQKQYGERILQFVFHKKVSPESDIENVVNKVESSSDSTMPGMQHSYLFSDCDVFVPLESSSNDDADLLSFSMHQMSDSDSYDAQEDDVSSSSFVSGSDVYIDTDTSDYGDATGNSGINYDSTTDSDINSNGSYG